MRPPRSALLLALAACTLENPAFKAGPQGGSGGGTSAGESTTTTVAETEPAVTTTTGPVTTGDTTSTSTSGTTLDPVTSTEPLTSSTTEPGPDLPNECNLTVFGDTAKYAFNVTQSKPMADCNISETWKTKVVMEGGVLTILDTFMCDTMAEHDTLRLGDGWPTMQDRTILCAEVNVFWHPAEPGMCRIGTIWVKDLDPDFGLPYFVYAASLNHPMPPPGFPLWPGRALVDGVCGCAAEPTCCDPQEPGEYKLLVDQDQILPNNELKFEWMNKMFRIFNIQSYVDSTCNPNDPNDPFRGQHFDWFGEEVLP